MITFRRVTPSDFPTLALWLSRPHVSRWWNHEYSLDAVERDFGPTARGEEPAEDLLAMKDGTPFGLVQRSYWRDYPDELAELEPFIDVPDSAMTIDYLIGDATDTGRGLGTAVITAVVADTWRAHPAAAAIIVPVAAGNPASWRALEKAGFIRIGQAQLEPDNPIDPRLHFVYRLDRPHPGRNDPPDHPNPGRNEPPELGQQ